MGSDTNDQQFPGSAKNAKYNNYDSQNTSGNDYMKYGDNHSSLRRTNSNTNEGNNEHYLYPKYNPQSSDGQYQRYPDRYNYRNYWSQSYHNNSYNYSHGPHVPHGSHGPPEPQTHGPHEPHEPHEPHGPPPPILHNNRHDSNVKKPDWESNKERGESPHSADNYYVKNRHHRHVNHPNNYHNISSQSNDRMIHRHPYSEPPHYHRDYAEHELYSRQQLHHRHLYPPYHDPYGDPYHGAPYPHPSRSRPYHPSQHHYSTSRREDYDLQSPFSEKDISGVTPESLIDSTPELDSTSNSKTSKSPNKQKQFVCNNCGTEDTPLWRRDDEGKIICNACRLYFKLHNEKRPTYMCRPIIRRRCRTSKKSTKKSDKNSMIESPLSQTTEISEDSISISSKRDFLTNNESSLASNDDIFSNNEEIDEATTITKIEETNNDLKIEKAKIIDDTKEDNSNVEKDEDINNKLKNDKKSLISL